MPQKTKFGINQIDNPTPEWMKTTFRLFSFFSGLTAVIMLGLPHVPEHVKYVVLTATGIGNTVIHFTIKFFGLQGSGYN